MKLENIKFKNIKTRFRNMKVQKNFQKIIKCGINNYICLD